MENVPQIKLSDLTPAKIAGIADGVKIFDIETSKYYEKREGKFQVMVEESEEEQLEVIEEPHISTCDADNIRQIVASGNKHIEVDTWMKLRTARNELLSQKETLSEKVNFMFSGTPEQVDIIAARLGDTTKEALENASLEELRQYLEFDGKPLPLNMEEVLSEQDIIQGHREFLIYLKSLEDVSSDIDAQVREIDSLCELFSDDVKEKSKSMYEWDNFIYEIFKERLTKEDISEDERERIKRLIQIKDDAITLAPLYEIFKEELNCGREKSLIYAFKNRFVDTLKKAERYANTHGYTIYFQVFDNIEETIGYPDYKNFFAYLLARYIKFNQEKFSKIDNAFVAQVTQNVVMLKKGELKEPNKSAFIKGIKDILELFVEK